MLPSGQAYLWLLSGQQLARLPLRTEAEVAGLGDTTFLENEFYELLPKAEIYFKVELFPIPMSICYGVKTRGS